MKNQTRYEEQYQRHGVSKTEYAKYTAQFWALMVASAVLAIPLGGAPAFIVLGVATCTWGAIKDPARVAGKRKRTQAHENAIRLDERSKVGALLGGVFKAPAERLEKPTREIIER